MANDFSSDANCVALWRFEPGSLFADSKGSNTLTMYQDDSSIAVLNDATHHREGFSSAHFDAAESDNPNYYEAYLTIAAGAIDSGFPLTGSDAVQKISGCLWFRPEDFNSGTAQLFRMGRFTQTAWIGAGDGTNGSVNGIAISISNSSGSSATQHTSSFTFTPGQWYHVGFAVDGANGTYALRIWDETAATDTDFSGTFTGPMHNLSGGESLRIGEYLDANEDEVVIFNSLLSSSDIDEIRQGIYGGGGSSDSLSVNLQNPGLRFAGQAGDAVPVPGSVWALVPNPKLHFSGEIQDLGTLNINLPLPGLTLEGYQKAPIPVQLPQLSFKGIVEDRGSFNIKAPFPSLRFIGVVDEKANAFSVPLQLPGLSLVGHVDIRGTLNIALANPGLEFGGDIPSRFANDILKYRRW